MEYHAGITCMTQDPDTGAVEPQFGYAVVDKTDRENAMKDTAA